MYIFDEVRVGRIRRELAVLLNRDISQQEIATLLTRRLSEQGKNRVVTYQTVRRLEKGLIQRIDLEIINALIGLYSEYGVDARDILRFVPEERSSEDEASPGNLKPVMVAA